MAFPYKHVVVVGATSGIGKAMADRLIEGGAKVTAVGRRKDRLQEFVKKHGEEKAQAEPFDILNHEQIQQFAKDVTAKHPDIDCLFLNAGIQRSHDFSKPETVDLSDFNLEIATNFTSLVTLAHAFLPFLLSKPHASIIITGSNLALVPAIFLPAYSASKAGLNAFTLCLREQLRETSVKVLELLPPAVQTELHDVNYGEEAGRKVGMPLDAFTEEAYNGLVSGKDQVIVGTGPGFSFQELADNKRSAFNSLTKVMRGWHSK